MHTSRQLFLVSMIIVLFAATAAAQTVSATLDAARTGQPITKLIFGGFMEPATTGVWAEMLSDRKFFNEITSKTDTAAPARGFGRRGPQRRWMPAGAARLWQLTAPAGTPVPPAGPGRGGFGGPPATMAERPLSEAPRKITLPPASISVYEFAVK